MNYTENGTNFIKANAQTYINQFADYWLTYYDFMPTDSELKKEFNYWLYDYKNIKADLRYKIFKDILNKSFDLIVEGIGQ